MIYGVMEFGEGWLEGIKMKEDMEKIEGCDCGVKMRMGVGWIVGEEDEEKYGKGKGGLRLVCKKGGEYEDDKIWLYRGMMEEGKIEKGRGIGRLDVYEGMWRGGVDFRKGLKK